MKILRLNPKKTKAQAIVEFAIALPVLLLILYGVMETGRYILIVSFVNNASRQAARYGSTSGVNPATGVPRYQDCQGIRDAAQKSDFLNAFDDNDIFITYDGGPGTSEKIITRCDGTSGSTVAAANGDRVTVEIKADFNAVVPNLVPFISRTVAKGNPVIGKSSRTLVLTISIAKTGGVKEDPNVSITGPTTSEVGETATFFVTVASSTTPTGDVEFKDVTNNITLCTATLSGITASCDVAFTTLGARNIRVDYLGDPSHNAQNSSEMTHTVEKASVTITILSTSPNPSGTNQQVAVSVNVADVWGGTTPTQTVAITGADTNCTITLSGGTGSCNVTFNSIGSKTLTASYGGDSLHKPSNPNATKGHTVAAVNDTTTTITSPAASQSLTATFSVTVGGLTTPAGTVVFTQGATTLCTVNLSNGTGTCTYTFTSPGAKNITATYTSSNGLNSSSASQTVTVGATVTTITAGIPSNGVVPITATVTGSGTINGTVAITGADVNCTITITGGTGTPCNVTFNSSVTNKTLTGTFTPSSTHAGSSGTTNVTVTVVSNISCAISAYTLGSWSGAFNANPATVTNTGTTTINGWTLTWTFPNGQTVSQMYNANYTQSGSAVTATDKGYNATINPGGTADFSFQGTWNNTANNYPSDFKLNGVSCTPPPVTSCNTSTVILSKLKFVNGNMVLPINNTLPAALQIKDVTVTWYESKGSAIPPFKLNLQSASIGSTSFWTGDDSSGTLTITPSAPTYIPTGASSMTFTYDKPQSRWDDDSVTINLLTPGCEGVVLNMGPGPAFHE